MEGVRSDFARAAGEASAGSGKGKKNRASSEVLLLVSEGLQSAVTETTSAWPGKKKTKITPTSDEHSSGKIVGGPEQEREEIEGLDWGIDKLANKIDGCLGQLVDTPLFDHRIVDDKSSYLNEEQLGLLNQRLALCRIRAHEEGYQDMDDESLSELFPLSDLAAEGYYKHYEVKFEWFFDPVYCQYAHLEDYQRLMLQNYGEYEDWEYYRRICSSLEGDQQFVQFWEELYNKTKLIKLYMTMVTSKPSIGRLFYYHALKIATGYPKVCKILIETGFIEFKQRVHIEFFWYPKYAAFLLSMWKLLYTGEKVTFERALKAVYDNGMYSFIFTSKKFDENLDTLEELYKPLLDSIGEKTEEDRAKELIIQFIEGNEGKRKTYYDYAKRKLSIAKKIGLIRSPPTEAPLDKAVHGHTVKHGIGSTARFSVYCIECGFSLIA